ncbi:ABC transporter ATP-binding protein [Streptomyces sp. NPDC001675]
MTELRFEDATVRFGSRRHGMTAVDGVDLTVPDGTIVGLVGESGSGKSTLARAAVGLTPLTSGRVLLDGRPLPAGGRAARWHPVQMVFQDPYSSLDPRMTVGASIAEALPRAERYPAAARRARVQELLDLVDLAPERAAGHPGGLSGGQRQRVALARALAAGPEVLIADEITSALDVSVQGTVLNLVRDLQRRMGLSLLFISHNLAVVRYVSDFIAVMYLGRIVEYGPADEVLTAPRHPYTRELLDAAPAGHAPGPAPGPADAPVAEPPDPHRPPSGCHFHPRCPAGPLAHPDREPCRSVRPALDGVRHLAACHYAARISPSAR